MNVGRPEVVMGSSRSMSCQLHRTWAEHMVGSQQTVLRQDVARWYAASRAGVSRINAPVCPLWALEMVPSRVLEL